MRRTAVLVALTSIILAVDVCGRFVSDSTAAALESLADSLAGGYARPHYVWFPENDFQRWVPVLVDDSLALAAGPNGTLQFKLSLSFDNGHSCFVEGIAVADSAGFEYRETVDCGTGPVPCRLRITVTRHEVIVNDPLGTCECEYCGVRGSIHDVRFSRRGYDPRAM